jgi:hypothetical protein
VGYFNCRGDKQTLTPKDADRSWYKMESVDLDNAGDGNLSFIRSDSVGVISRWEWPTSESFVEGVTANQLLAIKNWLKLGEHRESDQARDWAGKVVADVLQIGVTDKAQKARIVSMLATWVKDGHWAVYTKNDENRIARKFIRTA